MTPTVEVDGIPVAGDLLRTHVFNGGKSKKAVPLMMEFQVNPDTGPFLISSGTALLWVPHRNAKVRAAFRPMQPGAYFAEVVKAVAEKGVELEWGNVHPLTRAGLMAAIAHILSYDLPSPEILAHPDVNWGGITVSAEEVGGSVIHRILGCAVQQADWLDPGTVIVVPQDRDFVGFVLSTGTLGLSVVHNASRSIAVCRKTP